MSNTEKEWKPVETLFELQTTINYYASNPKWDTKIEAYSLEELFQHLINALNMDDIVTMETFFRVKKGGKVIMETKMK